MFLILIFVLEHPHVPGVTGELHLWGLRVDRWLQLLMYAQELTLRKVAGGEANLVAHVI